MSQQHSLPFTLEAASLVRREGQSWKGAMRVSRSIPSCTQCFCLKATLQSHPCTCSVEPAPGLPGARLAALLCLAATVAAHISPGEGKVPAGSWEAGWWGWRPPASP